MREHNHEAHKMWNFDRGDQTHRLDYPLTEDSVVWDVGAYEGNWAAQISNRYRCNVWLFEPVKEYYDALVEKFKLTPKVKVFPFGLGATTMKCFMAPDGDGSKPKESGEPSLIKSINEFIFENGTYKVDLLKLNIEGAEYGLMESLIEKNHTFIFNHYQIQFHTWENNCEQRHKFIVEEIAKTHDSSYSYPFIWEGWYKKITPEQEQKIIADYFSSKKTFKELSLEYCIPVLTVQMLVGKNDEVKNIHDEIKKSQDIGPGFGSTGWVEASEK
jgi:FkbM family methyltransferase